MNHAHWQPLFFSIVSTVLLLLRWRRRQTGRKRVLKLSTCKCVYRVSERICDIYSHLILIKAGGAPRFTFKYYHLNARDIPSLSAACSPKEESTTPPRIYINQREEIQRCARNSKIIHSETLGTRARGWNDFMRVRFPNLSLPASERATDSTGDMCDALTTSAQHAPAHL